MLPTLADLTISPNLQALLEFDDRLRTSSDSHERPGTEASGVAQPSQYPSWGEQEVPTVSLPPPRRKKSVVPGVPISPKAMSEFRSVSPPTNISPGLGEFGGPGEIMFARPEGAGGTEGEAGSEESVNPYLNSPPSSPRYFYPQSDDEEEEEPDRPSPFYALGESRSVRRSKRQRSFGGHSPVERREGQLVSPRYFASFGHSGGGSGPKEKGENPIFVSPSIPPDFCCRSGWTTCNDDEAAARAQPQGFSLLFVLSSGASVFSACGRSGHSACSSDRHFLRTIIFPRTSHLHLEVLPFFRLVRQLHLLTLASSS